MMILNGPAGNSYQASFEKHMNWETPIGMNPLTALQKVAVIAARIFVWTPVNYFFASYFKADNSKNSPDKLPPEKVSIVKVDQGVQTTSPFITDKTTQVGVVRLPTPPVAKQVANTGAQTDTPEQDRSIGRTAARVSSAIFGSSSQVLSRSSVRQSPFPISGSFPAHPQQPTLGSQPVQPRRAFSSVEDTSGTDAGVVDLRSRPNRPVQHQPNLDSQPTMDGSFANAGALVSRKPASVETLPPPAPATLPPQGFSAGKVATPSRSQAATVATQPFYAGFPVLDSTQGGFNSGRNGNFSSTNSAEGAPEFDSREMTHYWSVGRRAVVANPKAPETVRFAFNQDDLR